MPPLTQAQWTGSKPKPAVGGLTLSSRLALAMVSLVVVSTAVLSFFTYHSVTQVAIPRALDRLATEAALTAAKLEAALNGARRDVLMIQSGAGVAQLAAASAAVPGDQPAEKQIRESIEARFAAILQAKPEYAELRIIGAADGGRELVRVDRRGPGGASRAVPDAELIRLGERDYFKRTIDPQGRMLTFRRSVRGRCSPGRAAMSSCRHAALRRLTASNSESALSILISGPSSIAFGPRATAGIQVFIANGAGDYLFIRTELANSHPRPARGAHPGRFSRIRSRLGGRCRSKPRYLEGSKRQTIWRRLGAMTIAGGPGLTILFAARYSNLDLGLAAVSSSAQVGGGLAVLLAMLLALLLARSLSSPWCK